MSGKRAFLAMAVMAVVLPLDAWAEGDAVRGGELYALYCATCHGAEGAGGGEWSTGVFFEFEGHLTAVVGILFRSAASEAVVRAVVGEPSEPLPPHSIESALMEIGNILASHVASAIADTLGVRLLPSIPTLAMSDAQHAFIASVAARKGEHPIRIECELSDDTGELEGLLILIPEGAGMAAV